MLSGLRPACSDALVIVGSNSPKVCSSGPMQTAQLAVAIRGPMMKGALYQRSMRCGAEDVPNADASLVMRIIRLRRQRFVGWSCGGP